MTLTLKRNYCLRRGRKAGLFSLSRGNNRRGFTSINASLHQVRLMPLKKIPSCRWMKIGGLALLVALGLGSPSFSQIVVPPRIEPVKPIIPELPGRVIDQFRLGEFRAYEQRSKRYSVRCRDDNTSVIIEEDPANEKVRITINDLSETKSQDSILEFNIKLCGVSNSLTYKLKGPNLEFTANRNFKIKGKEGFDYVSFKLGSNSSGRNGVELNSVINIDMDLGGGQDQVEVRLNNTTNRSSLALRGTLGGGHDGMSWITRDRSTLAGEIVLDLDGSSGDDHFFIDMYNGITAKTGSRTFLKLVGDTRDKVLDPKDNVPDHGRDSIHFAFGGEIDGDLEALFIGDDGALRIPDTECIGFTSTECVFFYSSRDPACLPLLVGTPDPNNPGYVRPTSPECRDLEHMLKNVPRYGYDSVQAAVIIAEGSTGTSNVKVDGGLSGDDVVLLHRIDAERKPPHKGTITGGQIHRSKTDACYPRLINAIPATNCDVFTRDIVHRDFDFFFE